jgi:hypothetical protein
MSAMPKKNREESRAVLITLVGMRLTECFYDGDEIVLEFDCNHRLQLSTEGCEVWVRTGGPKL